jgi:hypothetical protein
MSPSVSSKGGSTHAIGRVDRARVRRLARTKFLEVAKTARKTSEKFLRGCWIVVSPFARAASNRRTDPARILLPLSACGFADRDLFVREAASGRQMNRATTRLVLARMSGVASVIVPSQTLARERV